MGLYIKKWNIVNELSRYAILHKLTTCLTFCILRRMRLSACNQKTKTFKPHDDDAFVIVVIVAVVTITSVTLMLSVTTLFRAVIILIYAETYIIVFYLCTYYYLC
jgi:hypothetical protein